MIGSRSLRGEIVAGFGECFGPSRRIVELIENERDLSKKSFQSAGASLP